MILNRTGTHVLRLVEDQLGRHYACTCGLFSVPAQLRAIPTAGAPIIKPAVTVADAITRHQAHIDALRLDCERPWRWARSRRRAA